MLAELIARFQSGDNCGAETIIQKFQPLMRKYAYMLNYEDAYDDLVVDLVNLIHHVKLKDLHSNEDSAIVIYLQKSIRSFYIKHLATIKKNQYLVCYSDLSESEVYKLESHLAIVDHYFENTLSEIRPILSRREWTIISLIFISGYSVKEIATFWGITKQATNQLKNRALKKIELYWEIPEIRRTKNG